jgi:hypothetical protein
MTTEHIIKTDKNGESHIVVKFHAPVKRFKRVETFKFGGRFYKIYVNNRNCVHHIERTEVTSWKEITKNKRVIKVPDTFEVILEPKLMNKIRGNSYEVAIQRIMTEIEKENIFS